MASIDAYQKLCGLIADPGSSGSNTRSILIRLAQEIKKNKKLQATSSKLQAWQPVPEMIGYSLSSFNDFPLDKFVKSLLVPGTG